MHQNIAVLCLILPATKFIQIKVNWTKAKALESYGLYITDALKADLHGGVHVNSSQHISSCVRLTLQNYM